VLNHYAELGITPAEMLFTIHMWQFRWTERDPHPSLTTIADKMDVSWWQAHRYANSLKKKGFLIIKSRQEPGRGQVTSEYDFEPLIKAVLKPDKDDAVNSDTPATNDTNLVENHESAPINSNEDSRDDIPLTKMTGGGMTDLTEAPLTQMSEEEYKEQEDPSQEDVNLSNIRKATSLTNSGERKPTSREARAYKKSENEEKRERIENSGSKAGRGQGFSSIGATLVRSNLRLPPKPYGEEHQVIMDYVARFAKEFSDQASLKTSTTRAYNLSTRSKLPLGVFIGRMYEAQAITKERAAPTPKRHNPVQSGQPGTASPAPRGRPAKNRMAYWFSVLEDRLGLRKKGKESKSMGEGELNGVQKSS
jgi:hypothetical protein